MTDTAHIMGITDLGQPVVSSEGSCEHWSQGSSPTLPGRRECWYCRWADFRKTTEVMLTQSVCRCPENRVSVVRNCKNERTTQTEVGRRHE